MAAAVLRLLLAVQSVAGASGLKFAEPLRINPERPACMTARAFPVVKARIEPWDTVKSARVYFRPRAYPRWYSVPMQRARDGFVALLPKPRPSAQAVLFFVEAEALRMRARSLEQAARVVEDAAECGGPVAESADTATITVAVPKGAPPVPPVPPGFEPVGAVGEEKPGNTARDSLITAAVVAGAAGTALVLGGGKEPAPLTAEQQIAPELTVLDSVPPPESRLFLSQGALLSVRVHLRLHQAIHPGSVTVTLFRQDEGALRPCGLVQAAHNGFLQGAVQEVMVSGPLQQARPCEPSDRVRITVTQLGQQFLATGGPGIPDAALRYFVSP